MKRKVNSKSEVKGMSFKGVQVFLLTLYEIYDIIGLAPFPRKWV